MTMAVDGEIEQMLVGMDPELVRVMGWLLVKHPLGASGWATWTS